MKSNLYAKPTALGFRISEDEPLTWKDGPVDIDVNTLLGPTTTSDENKTKKVKAEEFLLELLDDGPIGQETVMERAKKKKEIRERTLDRAKESLGIMSSRITKGNQGKGYWEWSLPPDDGHPPGNANLTVGPNVGILTDNGYSRDPSTASMTTSRNNANGENQRDPVKISPTLPPTAHPTVLASTHQSKKRQPNGITFRSAMSLTMVISAIDRLVPGSCTPSYWGNVAGAVRKSDYAVREHRLGPIAYIPLGINVSVP